MIEGVGDAEGPPRGPDDFSSSVLDAARVGALIGAVEAGESPEDIAAAGVKAAGAIGAASADPPGRGVSGEFKTWEDADMAADTIIKESATVFIKSPQ